MTDHLLTWIAGLAVALVAAVAASIAARVQLLPDVIDISIIPTGAGLGSLALAFYGALRGFNPDRVGRLTLFGTLLGGGIAAFALLLALVGDVLW
jgi:hypothetical protein